MATDNTRRKKPSKPTSTVIAACFWRQSMSNIAMIEERDCPNQIGPEVSERLTPVLMTALVAAFALVPLLLAASAPGKEILHPVTVVIFGGLARSTILNTLLTPLIFWLVGAKPLAALVAEKQNEAY